MPDEPSATPSLSGVRVLELAPFVAAQDAAGVPAGPILSIGDIAADPQFKARGMLARVPDERACPMAWP